MRGYILIQEVPGEGHRHNTDYRLTDLGKGRSDLRPYEVLLLDSLFETGSVVELSDLKYKFSAKLTKLRNALYDDAIDKGWFSRRPDHVRLLWRGVGLVVLAVGVLLTVLAVSQRWGLAAIPVPIIGLLLVIFAGKMPRRTPKGTAMYSRIEGFRQIFDAGQGVREQFAERQNIFSEYLPFAIVYGCTKKWAQAFEGLDAQVTQSTSTWYIANHPFTALGVRELDRRLLDERDRHVVREHAVVFGWEWVRRRRVLRRRGRRRRWRQLVADRPGIRGPCAGPWARTLRPR